MFANPLGLLALLAVPAVLALHLYRRRFEPREVAGLFLWAAQDHAPVAGRQREPLRTNASLWFELLCAALLALAFSGPRSSCAASRGEHLVVVLDGSASMQAADARSSTRERALERLRERLDALPRGSRVTLVESGRRPRLLAGPAALVAQAREALETWRPQAVTHDVSGALALALQFASSARLLVITDHFAPEKWPENVELLAVGEPRDNWAITHAARTLERDEAGVERERLFLTVASFAAKAREFDLVVSTSGRELARSAVKLAPGARTHLALAVPVGAGALEVRAPTDALGVDDAVFLAPPLDRPLALWCEWPLETQRALGLAQAEDEGLARWRALVPRSTQAADLERAHLVLGSPRATSGPAWFVELAELGPERRDWLGPFLVDRTHPLLEGVTLDGAVWSGDPQLRLAGAPLISIGDVPLLSEERAGARRIWRLNLDPQRSSLQRTPDWPILLANFAELRRTALPGPERTNLALGQRFVHRPGDEVAGLEPDAWLYTLRGPLQTQPSPERELRARSVLEFDGFETPGWYEFALGERVLTRLGVSFLDAAESDLRAAGAGRRESSAELARIDEELSWLELAALAGALACACLDWWVLSRASAARRS